MKDFISKLTFGFIMAQFIPGAVAVYSIAFLYTAFTTDINNSIKAIVLATLSLWSSMSLVNVMFIALCTGTGMLIHGVHWAVLAYLEAYFGTKRDGKIERKPIYKTFWHDFPIFIQILLGPVKILIEIFGFLFTASELSTVATHENVPNISKDKMEAFNYLQDFYLYFAQFYAHLSYSLLISFFCLIVFVCFFGLSTNRIILLATIYFLTGVFFIIGRIQLATLFIAEHEMCNKDNSAHKKDKGS